MEVDLDVSGIHNHQHHHQQQQQELSSQTLESMLQVCTKGEADKKPRPPEESLKCPRCDSSNTKFCYYNNYSLTQPRYFCKSCRRYWTKGGTLRNVPVGGGCRKNRRSSSSSTSSSVTSSITSSCSASSKIKTHQTHHDHIIQQHPLTFVTPHGSNNNTLLAGVPTLPYDSTCTDLSLAFARLQSQANYRSMSHDHFDHFDQNNNHLGSGNNMDHLGFLDAIRGNFLETTTNPNQNPNRFHNNMLYNGTNLENGDMGNVGNLMGLNNVNNHNIFNDHQEQEQDQPTTGVTITPVKQEACNMMKPTEVGLWGYPCLMGGADSGTMVHEVESAGTRSMIGGWNGIGSTNWHGLINSPLM